MLGSTGKCQARPLFAELPAPPRDDFRTDPMQRLIQANGQPHYGIFPSAPQHINYRDFDFRSPMGRRVGPWANGDASISSSTSA